MSKSMQILYKVPNLIYAMMQGLLLFFLLMYALNRFGTNPFQFSTTIPLFMTQVIMFLPLVFLKKEQQLIWVIFVGLCAFMLGLLFYGFQIGLVVLLLGVIWFTSNSFPGETTAIYLFKFFCFTLLWITFVFAIIFPIAYPETEIKDLFKYLFLFFLLTLIGTSFSHLRMISMQSSSQSIFASLKDLLGSFWGLMIMIMLISLPVYKLIEIILDWALKGAVWILTQTFSLGSLLVQKIIELIRNSNVQAPESRFNLEGFSELTREATEAHAQNNELFLKIAAILDKLTIVAAFLVAIWLIYYFYRKISQNLQSEGDHQGIEEKIIVERTASNDDKGIGSMAQKGVGNKEKWVYNHGDHHVRKQFQKLLSSLRKKGVWSHDSMSLSQLNVVMQQLKETSTLYEKVRYGDQTLTQEELMQFESEYNQLMKSMKRED